MSIIKKLQIPSNTTKGDVQYAYMDILQVVGKSLTIFYSVGQNAPVNKEMRWGSPYLLFISLMD